jgi:hypothetical protein
MSVKGYDLYDITGKFPEKREAAVVSIDDGAGGASVLFRDGTVKRFYLAKSNAYGSHYYASYDDTFELRINAKDVRIFLI